MKIRNQNSRLSEVRHAGRRQSIRSTLCSCTEARRRRNGAIGESDPLNHPSEFKIPEPLCMDQNELCQSMQRAAAAGGKTGAVARKLLKVLQPHLLKEETDLLQTLGLLMPLSRGQVTPAMRQIPARD